MTIFIQQSFILGILLAFGFNECFAYDGRSLSSALSQAVQRLLDRHASFILEPVEEVLAVRLDGFPDPNSYVLPNALLWEPHTQLPHFFQTQFLCPSCVEQGNNNILKSSGWKDGRATRHMPRRIYGLAGIVLLISRVYTCRAGHEINGHDPAILIKCYGRIPFLLSHKTGVTRELIEMFVSMVRNGLSFAQVHDILLERLHMRHLDSETRFLEDLSSYSARHPVVLNYSFPEFSELRECPSRNTISDFFLHYFDLNEQLYIERMSITSANEGWLSCDHTFNVTGSIGYERKEDKKWIRQFESLFCVMNEKGQIVTWQLTHTQGFENIRRLLQQLHKRLSAQGVTIKEFYIDNCCHWRKKLQEIFGAELLVLLDLFHAFQRISCKISKRHQFHWNCLQDIRLIFRDPADLGEKRARDTPDPETLLKNAEMFLKRWKNVASANGSPVLSEEAINEVHKVMEHMRKGCLSGM